MTGSRRGWALVGFVFGCALVVFGFGAAGAGHGSYLLLALSAAPVSLMPGPGLFAAPFWWAWVGWLLKQRQSVLLIVALAIHTVCAALILLFGTLAEPGAEQWESWHRVERVMPTWIWSGIVAYSVGLIAAWVHAVKEARRDIDT
jgi:hypothetical protein